jgi:uncharacterized protein (DUF2384 family)
VVEHIPADERARNRNAGEIIGARVKVVMIDLLEVFEHNEAFLWVITPQPLLERDVPFLLLQTAAGFRRVKAVLERLKDGAFI